MNITKDNLQSEFQAYERYLKDDEMRSKVQETFELIEFYDEDNDCRRAVDAICEMVNRFIAKGKTAEPAKPAASDDKERRLKLLKLKAKAIKMKLELRKLDGMDALDTVAPNRTAQRQMVDDVREHFAKHWDAERGEYVYTDFDGDQWYKNKKGHFCLLNGCDGDGEPRFTFDWEGRVAYIYGFAPDEYEAARDFCAEKVDEKVMRGSGWHFGASGYDNHSKSWRFFILYGAMAAGIDGTKGYTRKEYEKYLNEVGKSLSEDEFIIGGKMRRMPYGKALRKYSPITFNAGYNEWKQGLGGVNGNSDSEQHAIDVIKKRYPKKDVGEIKEFVGNHWGEWPSDISDDEIVKLFEYWYFGDDINVLYDRFPDNEAEIQEYYNELHAWDWNKPRYDNLKAFKVWLDDRTNNAKEGGDLFESYWAYYGEKGTLTPLYNIDDLYGEDYDFAYQWLQEFLQADGYSLDRFWVNENDNTYGYLAK